MRFFEAISDLDRTVIINTLKGQVSNMRTVFTLNYPDGILITKSK